MLNLRIRGPSGATTISISANATRDELDHLISTETHLHRSQFEVRFGFPKPQIIPSSDPSTPIHSLGIKNGETLQVSVLPQHLPSTPTGPDTPLSKPPQLTTNHLPRAPAKSSLSSMARVQDQSTVSPTASRAKNLNQLDSISASVPLEAGHLILRIVPDDNSCLFRAAGLLLDHASQSTHHQDISNRFRQIVADAVMNDPITWCEPILGRDPTLYVSKILEKDVWGGAIELAILAQHFKTEICSIDVQTGRVDQFGQSENYPNRIFLVYSGIHYDAITLSPIPPEELSNQSMSFPPELDFDMTIFPSDQESFLHGALQLVSQLRQLHYYTDTASFSLRCEICKTALVGEKDARSHAEATGHTQFGEFA